MAEQNMTSGQLPTILMTAAEGVPFSKTGGLADVMGALSRSLFDLGFQISVMLPYHRITKEQFGDKIRHIASFEIDLGWRSQYVGIEHYDWEGLPVYFIDNEYYFGHAIYQGGTFEGEQYAFFSRAVLEALPLIGLDPDIIHVNDWHTAIIPMLLKTQYTTRPQGRSKTVLAIHNIRYQGRYDFGLVSDMLGIDANYNTPEFIEYHGSANLLKGGLVFADKLVTVSPTYAQEIKTPYFGEGLEGVLLSRDSDLHGILNGIDADTFNPATDTYIEQPYSLDSLDDKQKNKQALIEQLGINADEKRPIIAIISRLIEQKGLDLVTHVLGEIMNEDITFIVLGTGDAAYEDFFRSAAHQYGGRISVQILFDEQLAHKIYAGSDFLLVPSRFEPCGLTQMIALRYGTLPIVRKTGGLADTVSAYNAQTGEGNGFSFENFNAHEMLDTIRYAVTVYQDKQKHRAMQKRAMAQNVSFKKSAEDYAALYKAAFASGVIDTDNTVE